MKTTYTMHPRQTGLTLIEILVAMVISLILMAGVLQIFQANKQSFRVQESLSLIQENGRTAMRILAEDLRIADFWGCRNRSIDIEDNLDPDGANFVDLFANSGIAGTNGTGAGVTPDTITINGARNAGFTVNLPMVDENAAISVTDATGIRPGDIMLVTDCTGGDIFQVTNPDPLVAGDAIQPAALSRTYNNEAMVFHVRQTTYSITPDPDSNVPSLSRAEGNAAPLVLVEGIEDLQIEYGERIDINGTMRYVPAGTAGLNMNRILSVRITLDALSIATNVAVDNNADGGGAAGDGRLRRTFSNTINIRNRNQ